VDLNQKINETSITKAMLYTSTIMWWRMFLPYLLPLFEIQSSIDSTIKTLYGRMDDEVLLENTEIVNFLA
jgi:hypothetical protein